MALSSREKNRKLRELLAQPGAVIAPCCFDGISARAIQAAGFQVAGTTGYGMHGSLLGSPDNGLLSYGEMRDALSNICDSIDIPLLADAEGGYGNAVSVIRTVRDFEKCGVSGLFIEDQKLPPNCPFIKPTEQISIGEMVGKIHAALDTREDPNFLIVARTDAPFEQSVERANAYLEAGADMVKVLPKNKEELLAYPRLVKGPIHLGMYANKGINDGMTADDAAALGSYKIITYPMDALFAATAAMLDVLSYIHKNRTDEGYTGKTIAFNDYVRFIGGDEYKASLMKYVKE